MGVNVTGINPGTRNSVVWSTERTTRYRRCRRRDGHVVQQQRVSPEVRSLVKVMVLLVAVAVNSNAAVL